MSYNSKTKDFIEGVKITVSQDGKALLDLTNYKIGGIIQLENELARMTAYLPFLSIDVVAPGRNVSFTETDIDFLVATDLNVKCANYQHIGTADQFTTPLIMKSYNVECTEQLVFKDVPTRMRLIKSGNFNAKQIVIGSNAISEMESPNCNLHFSAPLVVVGQDALCDNKLSTSVVGDSKCEFLLYHENSMLEPDATHDTLNHLSSIQDRYFNNGTSDSYITTHARYPFKEKSAEGLIDFYKQVKEHGHGAAARKNPYTPNYMGDKLSSRALGVRLPEKETNVNFASAPEMARA